MFRAFRTKPRLLSKTSRLERDTRYLCEKCRQEMGIAHVGERVPADLVDQLKQLKSLYDRKVLGDEAYRDLIKMAVALHITHDLPLTIVHSVDKALEEKFTPERILEALTL